MSDNGSAASVALAEEVWGVTLLRYLSVMGMVVVQYDWLLTLDDEVRLVWPGKLHWPKALYYINRYVTIVMMIFSNYQIANFRPALSVNFCQIGIGVMATACLVRYVAATALLCLRVVVLYHGVRWMKWLLWIGFVLSCGLRLGLNIPSTYYYAESIIYSTRTDQCLTGGMKAMNTPLPGIITMTATMPFEILLLTLTIVKVYKSTTPSDSNPSSPIMRLLLRDGILWFLAIVVVRMTLVTIWLTLPPFLMTVAGDAEWGLESVLISRFFLNLRSAFSHGQPTLTTQAVPSTLSPIGTHPSWRRGTGASTGFTDGLAAETSVYDSLFDVKEGNVSKAATVDLELAVVLPTQHGGDEPPENKLTF